jgi:hypothetical protein
MAERDIVGGLFGMTPESYQRSMAARDSATNLTAAQLTPGQLAGFYAMEAGTGLGRAAQGLLGVEDPQLNMIRDVQQMRTQFDTSSAPGLRAFARSLAEKGYTDFAIQAATKADAMAKALLDQSKTAEETRLLGREIKEIGVDPNNPELVIKAAVDKDGKVISYIGQPYSRFTQKSTNITNLPAGESEFVKQLGKNDANTVTDAMKTRGDAINSLKNLNTLSALNDQELISGTYASGRVGAANLFNTLGLATKEDANRLATSEQFQKIGKDLILQTLGGKLGAGFSNEDRKFIEGLIPSLENSPDARRKLINFMQTKFGNIVTEVDNLENYARDKKGLGGYKYKTPLPSSSVAPGGAGKPTKAELEAEAAKRGIKL